MGGSSAADAGEVRYAPYLEAAHHEMIFEPDRVTVTHGLNYAFNAALNQSPYNSYEAINYNEGFFGVDKNDSSIVYEIKNFPSLWDMFGKFIGGVDVCDLWGQVYENITNGPEINNAVAAHSELLQDDINSKVLPSFLAGMRDINAVQSTAFVVGKSIIQSTHVKAVNKFAGDLRIHTLDISTQVWAKHLDWNKAVVMSYADLHKLYYSAKMDLDKIAYEYQSKDILWDLSLFDYARAFLGALNGAMGATGGSNQPSQTSQAIGGALSGAALGASVGGAPGAAIGGVLGAAASFF